MKKLTVLVIILTLAAGGVFAQSETETTTPKNTIYGGFGFGVGLPFFVDGELFFSYEYAIIPQFSVGANISLQMYPMAIAWMIGESIAGSIDGEDRRTINNFFGYIIEGQAHWYPAGKTFHIDLGVGYSNYVFSMHTILIAPGIGWRIDFGQPGGFIMNIGLRLEFFQPLSGSVFVIDDSSKTTSIAPVNFLTFRLGFGYRF